MNWVPQHLLLDIITCNLIHITVRLIMSLAWSDCSGNPMKLLLEAVQEGKTALAVCKKYCIFWICIYLHLLSFVSVLLPSMIFFPAKSKVKYKNVTISLLKFTVQNVFLINTKCRKYMKTLLALPTKTKTKPNQPIKQAKKNTTTTTVIKLLML